jgi:hypothetical protein
MKKLNITWDGIEDKTGFLFSFAKSLSAAVKNSPYSELSEDIIASSGFAFRMWAAKDLCPSAMSIWAFNQQKPWVENGGLKCDYIERLWGLDDIEEERRQAAIEMIKKSIDNGIAAVSWDIGIPEWGLVIGYDDKTSKLLTLSITGVEGEMDYAKLGKNEIPILNVLTITGKINKHKELIIKDTLTMVKKHLNGEEWSDNTSGLKAYEIIMKRIEKDFNPNDSWSVEYYLGTYAALKWYAYKFLKKYGLNKLANIYKEVYDCWYSAFLIKKSTDLTISENRKSVYELLNDAYMAESEAIKLM